MAFLCKDLRTWVSRIKIIKSSNLIYYMQPLKISRFEKKLLAKHNGLAAVQKHPMLGMLFHRTSQRSAFKIAASNRQSLGAHRVIYAGNVLHDAGPVGTRESQNKLGFHGLGGVALACA